MRISPRRSSLCRRSLRWSPAASACSPARPGFGAASPDIFWQIRVPRVLAGFGAGAALALSGALMQLLTRNALADPYVLGVAGGASVGALGAMLVAGAAGGCALGVGRRRRRGDRRVARRRRCCSACSGAASPARPRPRARTASTALLLVGVMIGSGCSAIVSLHPDASPTEGQLRGMVFWLLGDLNGATHWEIAWIALAVALAIVWPSARQLDWLARGDAWAATLGVPVGRRRRARPARRGARHRRRGRHRRRDRLRRPGRAACAAPARRARRGRCCCRPARSAAAPSSSLVDAVGAHRRRAAAAAGRRARRRDRRADLHRHAAASAGDEARR